MPECYQRDDACLHAKMIPSVFDLLDKVCPLRRVFSRQRNIVLIHDSRSCFGLILHFKGRPADHQLVCKHTGCPAVYLKVECSSFQQHLQTSLQHYDYHVIQGAGGWKESASPKQIRRCSHPSSKGTRQSADLHLHSFVGARNKQCSALMKKKTFSS